MNINYLQKKIFECLFRSMKYACLVPLFQLMSNVGDLQSCLVQKKDKWIYNWYQLQRQSVIRHQSLSWLENSNLFQISSSVLPSWSQTNFLDWYLLITDIALSLEISTAIDCKKLLICKFSCRFDCELYRLFLNFHLELRAEPIWVSKLNICSSRNQC